MDRENVDTDAIIPKQFLKSIRQSGFGPNLFDAWRYLDPGEPGQDPASAPAESGFRAQPAALPRAPRCCSRARTSAAARRASTRRGRCEQYGFRALIAPSYADIFFNNCFKNGLLPIVLPEHQVARSCSTRSRPSSATRLTIDLERQVVDQARRRRARASRSSRFASTACSAATTTSRLTLRHADKIRAFEAERLLKQAVARATTM